MEVERAHRRGRPGLIGEAVWACHAAPLAPHVPHQVPEGGQAHRHAQLEGEPLGDPLRDGGVDELRAEDATPVGRQRARDLPRASENYVLGPASVSEK